VTYTGDRVGTSGVLWDPVMPQLSSQTDGLDSHSPFTSCEMEWKIM